MSRSLRRTSEDEHCARRPDAQRRRYVDRALALFETVPGALRVRRSTDRRFAATLFDRQVPLETVRAAMLLVVARRDSQGATRRFAPIASLHYFAPILDELLEEPLDPDYLLYLQRKVARLAPALLASMEP
jgi:hypothetical protein